MFSEPLSSYLSISCWDQIRDNITAITFCDNAGSYSSNHWVGDRITPSICSQSITGNLNHSHTLVACGSLEFITYGAWLNRTRNLNYGEENQWKVVHVAEEDSRGSSSPLIVEPLLPENRTKSDPPPQKHIYQSMHFPWQAAERGLMWQRPEASW